jgi:mannose-1-phosphate guanylyltransferase
VRVRYSWEQPVLGSAGGPRHALPLLADGNAQTFLIVNGDTLTELAVGEVIAAHERSGALVTMVLIPNPRPEQYGGVVVAPDGAITGFTRPREHAASYHFIGVQVAASRVFEDLPDGVPAESVRTLYPSLIASHPGSVRAFVCNAPFRDIGTPADYLSTSRSLAETEGNRLIAANAEIHPTAIVEHTTIWDDVTIGADARLTECIVCDGARVPGEARFTRSALVPARRRTPREDERLIGDLLIRNF